MEQLNQFTSKHLNIRQAPSLVDIKPKICCHSDLQSDCMYVYVSDWSYVISCKHGTLVKQDAMFARMRLLR